MDKKIKEIYEAMANKELSFGCQIEMIGHYFTFKNKYGFNRLELEDTENGKYCGHPVEYGNKELNKDIIGHPVMIGDVFDWMEDNFSEQVKIKLDMMGKVKENMYRFRERNSDMEIQTLIQNDNIRHNYNLKHFEILLNKWEDKRLPIESQSQECQNFVHSLIN